MKYFLIIITVMVIMPISSAFACSIGCTNSTMSYWFQFSHIVFQGKVISISSIRIPCSTSHGVSVIKYLYTFEVQTVWKGVTSQQVTLESEVYLRCSENLTAICSTFDRHFSVTGATYIVFANGGRNASICSPDFEPNNMNRVLLDNLARTTTSLHQQNRLSSSTDIFPNPARDLITIAYSLDNTSIVEFALFDIQGRQVQKILSDYQNVGDHKLGIDVSGLARGIYTCRLRIGNKTEVRQISVTG